jgi:hypothetical protein
MWAGDDGGIWTEGCSHGVALLVKHVLATSATAAHGCCTSRIVTQ